MKWNIIIAFLLLFSITIDAISNKPKKSNKDVNPPKESISRLFNLGKTPKKRGLLASVPTYSKGVDIPIVKHSLLKPFILDYPLKSVQIGVKIPMKSPTGQGTTGHGIVHHLKPTHIQPAVIKSAWPINCAHNNPPAPSVVNTEIALPQAHIPAPVPIVPAPTFHVQPAVIPIQPPPLTPVLPLPQAPIPFITKPLVKPILPFVAPAQFAPAVHAVAPAIIKPGNSIQTSYFATFPRHPLVNNIPLAPVLPAVHHQPLVPLVNKVPVNFIPAAHQVPIGHAHVGLAHHAFGITHHPIGKVPIGVLPAPTAGHIPLNAGHVHLDAGHVHLGTGNIPFSIAHYPLGPAHIPAPGDNVPTGVLPTSQIPTNPHENIPIGFGPIETTPVAHPQGENVPVDINGNIPNNNFPIGVGPSPTNIPLGIGDLPLENPFLLRPSPESGPTIIPTSDTGLIPAVAEEGGVHNIGAVDTNPWIPMTPSPSSPTPTPPQFIPESETNFAPTDNTNFNQGYHYRPHSNIPFEEINERFRNNEQIVSHENIQNQGVRNHFSLRQHLPLRRPFSNFAAYS